MHAELRIEDSAVPISAEIINRMERFAFVITRNWTMAEDAAAAAAAASRPIMKPGQYLAYAKYEALHLRRAYRAMGELDINLSEPCRRDGPYDAEEVQASVSLLSPIQRRCLLVEAIYGHLSGQAKAILLGQNNATRKQTLSRARKIAKKMLSAGNHQRLERLRRNRKAICGNAKFSNGIMPGMELAFLLAIANKAVDPDLPQDKRGRRSTGRKQNLRAGGYTHGKRHDKTPPL